MPERKYMSHISESCFVKSPDQHSIKEVLGGSLCNRADAVKHYKKYEHKWRKELKALKKQNEMLYRISNNSGSRHKLKRIKNIKAKACRKRSYYRSNSSSSDSDFDSSLYSDSD